MRFRELNPGRSRSKMESKKRGSRFMNGIFERYHAFKTRLRYGRRKPVHWWKK